MLFKDMGIQAVNLGLSFIIGFTCSFISCEWFIELSNAFSFILQKYEVTNLVPVGFTLFSVAVDSNVDLALFSVLANFVFVHLHYN